MTHRLDFPNSVEKQTQDISTETKHSFPKMCHKRKTVFIFSEVGLDSAVWSHTKTNLWWCFVSKLWKVFFIANVYALKHVLNKGRETKRRSIHKSHVTLHNIIIRAFGGHLWES